MIATDEEGDDPMCVYLVAEREEEGEESVARVAFE